MTDIVNKFVEVLISEIQVQEYYADILSYYANSKSTKPKMKEEAKEYAKKAEELFGNSC